MAGQGFSVKPADLLEIADRAKNLRDDLAGVGSVAGSLPNYKSRANESVLREALASFWDGEDVFATAYGAEHTGIVTTMQAMLGQLDALEKVCRKTAQQYSAHETETKTTVRRTEPTKWSE